MNSLINPQQIFAWARDITAQSDYHALTHHFLGLLEHLPQVEHVAAYEIYGGSNRKACEANSVCEQLIRRFPLELSAKEQESNAELLDEINSVNGFHPCQPNADGLFTRIVVSIRDVTGPDRALVLGGKFDVENVGLIENLVALYRNQVALHDGRERDVLTKLLNRQSFDRRLVRVCEYFQQHPVEDFEQDNSSWLAILDIDHFKRINDTFGHLYGDEVLLIFSQLLEKHFRYNDFLFRFGGEEFVVILNLVNRVNAEATFNRFRENIAEYPFPTVGQVTISIGMVHVDSAIMPTTLLDWADQAMYQAKRDGRNRLRVYQGDDSRLEVEGQCEPYLF